jgi:hypothetical protein
MVLRITLEATGTEVHAQKEKLLKEGSFVVEATGERVLELLPAAR